MSKALVSTIAVMFIAVSISPVGSLNAEKIDFESNESKVKSVEEQSFLNMSYDDVHNPDLDKEMLASYDDIDRELYERHPHDYTHSLRSHSDYAYDEPFFDYPDYEEFRDVYRQRYDDELVKNNTFRNRNPKPKPNFADGNIITVDDDGGADFTKIQDAINNASDGDTIFVYSGIYYENVVVHKSIILEGENRDTTIIDGNKKDDVVYVSADWVNISRFLIQNGILGIRLDDSNNNIISDNNIANNNDSGIYLGRNSSCNIFSGNAIKNNSWDGIEIHFQMCSSDNTIIGNTIADNKHIGIRIGNSSGNTITANTITNNDDHGIEIHSYSNNNTIFENTITCHNWEGICLIKSSNNNISNNTITNNKASGISLSSSSNNNLFDNQIINNDLGIWIVRSPDNTIFRNTISKNRWYGIYLYNKSSNNNVINGNSVTECGRYGILLHYSNKNIFDGNTISSNFLDGIVIKNAKDNIISNTVIIDHTLSGIFLETGILHWDEPSCNNVIKDCCIQQNWRGIEIDSYSKSNKITSCLITNNYWGIKLATSMWNIIEKCEISDNVCGIMRGMLDLIRRNNFIGNVLHAFGEWTYRSIWNRNYWSGHNTPFPYYVYGLNVDWFPKATPYDYNYPIPSLEYDNKNILWNWNNITLLDRDFEGLDNRFNLIDRVKDFLRYDFERPNSVFEEDGLSHYPDGREYLMNLREEIK